MKRIIMKSDVNNEQQPSEQPVCLRTASVSVFLISLFLKHAAREKKKNMPAVKYFQKVMFTIAPLGDLQCIQVSFT